MNTVTTEKPKRPSASTHRTGQPIPCSLDGKPVGLLGEPAAWLRLERHSDEIAVVPNGPLPRRCTIRAGALFRNERGFPEANIIMGRLLFPNGSTDPIRYRAFTRDPHRKLEELFLPVEAMPDDDWITSEQRWMNHQGMAKRVLAAAKIPWTGLSKEEIDLLVRYTIWPEPIEGCVLHALAQWSRSRGECIIEIGSYRGRSVTMLALATRGAGAAGSSTARNAASGSADSPHHARQDATSHGAVATPTVLRDPTTNTDRTSDSKKPAQSLIISVDPHVDEPHNREHVRLAMRQIDEENRLVQMVCPSDQAARMLGKGVASMIFIDGDHSYAQVLADYENYRDILAPGGVLAFHDYDYHDHNAHPALHPGVRRVVDGHVLRDPSFTPICLTHTLFAFAKHGSSRG